MVQMGSQGIYGDGGGEGVALKGGGGGGSVTKGWLWVVERKGC